MLSVGQQLLTNLRVVMFICSAPMDTNLLSNIHKLFSERIDIFSSVEFNKVSAASLYLLCSHKALRQEASLTSTLPVPRSL